MVVKEKKGKIISEGRGALGKLYDGLLFDLLSPL
jgi:hypothetical protein